MTTPIPTGFEAAHAEWLLLGGQEFRNLYRCGAGPRFYRSRYWKLVKESLLLSKKSQCFRCTGIANIVHHLNYDHVGEDHLHPESLAAVCKSCHGLIEYARQAESLISKISRRISLCQGFLRGRYREQNPAHIYARFLEYQDKLGELRNLFLSKIHYRNQPIKSPAESESFMSQHKMKRLAYEETAMNLVGTWSGSDKEKAEQLLQMLELEIQNCRKFVDQVFAPVPPRTENILSAVERETSNRSNAMQPAKLMRMTESITSGVEVLVVGIKFHRGHLDGITQSDDVELRREPNNTYDPNAIQVKLQNGEVLGYLIKEFAAVLAEQMDAGSSFKAEVSRIVRDKIYVSVTSANP